MTGQRERAANPEDLTRLFVECGNDGDAEGLTALYEPEAVIAFPPGKQTVGREAIRALYEQMLSAKPHFQLETPLPTLYVGDIALTATPALDEAGARAQVVRRQPDARGCASWTARTSAGNRQPTARNFRSRNGPPTPRVEASRTSPRGTPSLSARHGRALHWTDRSHMRGPRAGRFGARSSCLLTPPARTGARFPVLPLRPGPERGFPCYPSGE